MSFVKMGVLSRLEDIPVGVSKLEVIVHNGKISRSTDFCKEAEPTPMLLKPSRSQTEWANDCPSSAAVSEIFIELQNGLAQKGYKDHMIPSPDDSELRLKEKFIVRKGFH
ncbi:hypothetical protein WISP_58353 [Willisornis vidua]|uniref:Uncharacterized protein n=1 Tax=Willisornis vidua TaxID=1566151 RepID=A0ABQ9DFV1_9PASS|nr:hypothetical protein WISP_58353 [Willisornis vidua]